MANKKKECKRSIEWFQERNVRICHSAPKPQWVLSQKSAFSEKIPHGRLFASFISSVRHNRIKRSQLAAAISSGFCVRLALRLCQSHLLYSKRGSPGNVSLSTARNVPDNAFCRSLHTFLFFGPAGQYFAAYGIHPYGNVAAKGVVVVIKNI